MKERVLLMVSVIVVLVIAGSLAVSPAAARNPTVPFKGSYTTHPVILGLTPDGCYYQYLPGEGTATHLGLSTWVAHAIGCPVEGTQSGDMWFTAANGDELNGEFAGWSEYSMPGHVRFWGEYSITGGTGRFEGVTGSGTYEGTAELELGGEGILYFDGTLTK